MIRVDKKIIYTTDFKPVIKAENDFRYKISPKKKSQYEVKKYLQVFDNGNGFVPGLSVVDLIFNMGPDAINYLYQ